MYSTYCGCGFCQFVIDGFPDELSELALDISIKFEAKYLITEKLNEVLFA